MDEAISNLKSNRYRVRSVPTGSLEVKLHLYLHDPSGRSAIVEFIDGKVKVTKNPKIPVLTNTAYAEAIARLKDYREFGGERDISGGNESIDRFVRGAFYSKHLEQPKSAQEAVNFAFAAIQILSVSPRFPHGCTQWTIVSDPINRKIFFRTLRNPTIGWFDLTSMDFTPGNPVRRLDLFQTNLTGEYKAKK